MKHQEGRFAMQHHSQHPAKGHPAGTAGILVNDETITSETIERHIAEGKRLQAEAVAAFFRGCATRIRAVFQRHPSGDGAVPHRA